MSLARATTRATLAAALIALALGCAGGSGSSGFDLAESLIVQRVADRQECEELDGLTICPAAVAPPSTLAPTLAPTLVPTRQATTVPPTATATSEPTGSIDATAVPSLTPTSVPAPTEHEMQTPGTTASPTTRTTRTPAASPTRVNTPEPPPTLAATATQTQVSFSTPDPTQTSAPTATPTRRPLSTPTATPIPGMRIETNAPLLQEPLACRTSDVAGICDVGFEFSALGFEPGTAFRLAVRQIDAEEPWTIVAPTAVDTGGVTPSFGAEVGVNEIEIEAGGGALRVVVLAFDSDPGPVPERVTSLSDTGATLAFVTDEIPIAAP